MMQGGSPQEPFEVAEVIRLLNGGRDEVFRAVSLIDAAAARNDGVALERRALLEAVGFARPQSWDAALDSLEQAAEQGSSSAQDQLRILARAGEERHDWKAIRSSISIQQLIRPTQKRALSESPKLRVLDGFATAGECQWLVNCARDRLRPATVVTPSGSETVEAVRTNKVVAFRWAEMGVVMEVVRARISAATGLPLPLFEASQVLHYAPGQEFSAHLDCFDPQNPAHAEQLKRGQRIATVLVYLNDGYSGGETAFPRAGLSFQGKAGDALFIINVDRNGGPDPMTLHAGTPPVTGEKWIFSQWIRDRAPAPS